MKPLLCVFAIAIASCSLTPEQLQTIEINASKDVAAAAVGYLNGGQTGAIVYGARQVVRNHTSAKNPIQVTP